MEGQPLFPVGVGAILDVARGFRIVVVIHVLAAVHILVTGREEEAQPVVHHAVAIGQRGQEVGQGSLGRDAQILHSEVCGRHAVLSDIAQPLVGRLGGNAAMVEGEEIAVQVERVVARGEVGRQQPARRRVLHDQIDRATDAVAFQLCRERLVHLNAREDFGGEEVQRDEAILVVGAGNLDAVDERIIVAFIHAAENGILAFARGVSLNGDARNLLHDIAHRHVGSQFHGARTEHVDYVGREAFYLHGLGIRAAVEIGLDDHLGEAAVGLFHPNREHRVCVGHFHGPIA